MIFPLVFVGVFGGLSAAIVHDIFGQSFWTWTAFFAGGTVGLIVASGE